MMRGQHADSPGRTGAGTASVATAATRRAICRNTRSVSRRWEHRRARSPAGLRGQHDDDDAVVVVQPAHSVLICGNPAEPAADSLHSLLPPCRGALPLALPVALLDCGDEARR